MTQIVNYKHTIDSAFRECFYLVPDYQREYIWTEKEVSRLLDDIEEQMGDNSSEYFIGTVLVSPKEDKKNQFDVIDGQQRLTTIFLILCALRVLFKDTEQGGLMSDLIATRHTDLDGNVNTDLKLVTQYGNSEEVIRRIAQTKDAPQTVRSSIQNSDIRISGSVKNILKAYDVIYRFLTDNYGDKDNLKKYWGHLANNVIFIQISTDISSALKIFETINERGTGLTPMDLLKNLLFTRVSSDSFSELKDEWKKITNPLEETEKNPLRFLRYFLMANYDIRNGRADPIIREHEIYDWLSKKENAKLVGYEKDPFKFVHKITRNVNWYTSFRKELGNDGRSSTAMENLKKLTGNVFHMHYMLLLAAANLPKSLFDQFVEQLESFLFFYIFTKSPTKDLERNFSVWTNQIREIAHIQNPDDQINKLNEFVNERFAQNIATKTPELEDALKRLTFDIMGRARIRYLLARLTEHVDMAFSGTLKRGNLDDYFRFEIEHILPTKPENDLLNEWEGQNPGSAYDEFNNRLGNLTLLEKPINIVASNGSYSSKIPEYANSRNYLTRSLSELSDVGKNSSITRINDKLVSFDKWDAEAIDTRQKMLITLALDIWKITEITA